MSNASFTVWQRIKYWEYALNAHIILVRYNAVPWLNIQFLKILRIKNWISRIKMWVTVNLHLSGNVTGGYGLMHLILHCTAGQAVGQGLY